MTSAIKKYFCAKLPLFCSFVACILMGCFSSCSDERCEGGNEKVTLKEVNFYVPYVGNETLSFLHNREDTQVFIGTGKNTYYITEGASDENSCPKDFECVGIKFVNPRTNDILHFEYKRDKNLFEAFPYGTINQHTYYLLKYRNIAASSEIAIKSIEVANTIYPFAWIIGIDTATNYFAFKPNIGIVKMNVNGEQYELLK